MRLWADFNDVDGEMIWTSLRRASFIPDGEPEVGQWIELWDYEGNTCKGIVTRVDDPIVYLRLDLSTWEDAEWIQIERQFGSSAFASSQGEVDRTGGVERLKVA
jgi:hypothetical protein